MASSMDTTGPTDAKSDICFLFLQAWNFSVNEMETVIIPNYFS